MTSKVYYGSPRQSRLDAKETLPANFEIHSRQGHPLNWLHGPYKDPYLVTVYGEQLGLGSREHELVDVLPVEKVVRSEAVYIPAN